MDDFDNKIGMTDEEILKAAENIGSTPFTEPESEGEGGKEAEAEKTANPYAAYTSYDYGNAENAYERPIYETPVKKKKTGVFKKIFKFAGLAACFGVIAGGTFFGSVKALDSLLGDDSYLSSTAAAQAAGEVKALSLSNLQIASTDSAKEGLSDGNVVVNVVKDNMSCSVCVNCVYLLTTTDFWGRRYQYESTGGGSGFIVGTNDTQLLIATNCHVIDSAKSVSITFVDGKEVTGEVLDKDADNDLAIVAVKLSDIENDTFDAITVAKLGSSDDAEVGEMVIAIGNALGYGQSVTVGYLSAKDRKITTETGTSMALLQTDAAINSGNSGGPLFNIRGEVVGINCAKFSDTAVEGICFAIPISAAIPILDELMTHVTLPEAEQGWLGISMSTYSPELMGMPAGVYITGVTQDGPAEKAGIFVGDIITEINGKKITGYEALSEAIHAHRVNEEITITIKRQDNGRWKEMDVKAVLSEKPVSDQ